MNDLILTAGSKFDVQLAPEALPRGLNPQGWMPKSPPLSSGERARPVQKIEGSVTREVWTFTVTDIHALYASQRELVRLEPNKAAINEAIRNGLRNNPGLTVVKEIQTGVRL